MINPQLRPSTLATGGRRVLIVELTASRILLHAKTGTNNNNSSSRHEVSTPTRLCHQSLPDACLVPSVSLHRLNRVLGPATALEKVPLRAATFYPSTTFVASRVYRSSIKTPRFFAPSPSRVLATFVRKYCYHVSPQSLLKCAHHRSPFFLRDWSDVCFGERQSAD